MDTPLNAHQQEARERLRAVLANYNLLDPIHGLGRDVDEAVRWALGALADQTPTSDLAAPRPSGEREAPASLVALVTEWQEARVVWDETRLIEPKDVHARAARIGAAATALLAWRPSPPGERPVQSNDDEVICPACVHQFRAIPVNVQQQIAALTAQLAAAQRERDGYKRQAHGASEALLEALRLRKVETARADAAQAEAAALREALAKLIEQKHEPSEYYGVNDDMRCAFCGEDYIGHDRDEGARHTPDCAWANARAVLGGQPPTGGQPAR